MKTPEIICVTLANGDVALFVNGDAVLSLDACDAGANPGTVGKHLAAALSAELQEIHMDVPTDEDWSWNDVYELLPPSSHGTQATSQENSGKAIVVRVDPAYVPEDGDAFDAVQSALEHFEIPATLVQRDVDAAALPQATQHFEKAGELVERIAGLSIWDYDKNDGTPYEECEDPREGYLDSHCCLMDLIEEARRIPATDADIVPRIVIELDGGLIQGVTADAPIEYLVYDRDIEGCCDTALRPALDGGEVEVFASGIYVGAVNAEKISEIFAAVAAEQH